MPKAERSAILAVAALRFVESMLPRDPADVPLHAGEHVFPAELAAVLTAAANQRPN